MEYKIRTNSDAETKELAGRIAKLLKATDVVLLTGDLGAGKTTFVGGALEEYGYHDHVISPTFNIMKCYFEVNPPVFHIDAYRLEGQNIEIGLEEFIEGNGITFIEWPKFIEPLIPERHLEIELIRVNDSTRDITVRDPNGYYADLIKKLGE